LNVYFLAAWRSRIILLLNVPGISGIETGFLLRGDPRGIFMIFAGVFPEGLSGPLPGVSSFSDAGEADFLRLIGAGDFEMMCCGELLGRRMRASGGEELWWRTAGEAAVTRGGDLDGSLGTSWNDKRFVCLRRNVRGV
jgi:hypothetical protein